MTGVVVPAFNAASTIGTLLEKLQACVPDLFCIVVDDGSHDETARIAAQQRATVLRHDVNRGKGAALRTGFASIRSLTQLPYVITMDADLQHDPSEIHRFVAAWNRGEADIVIGSRPRFGAGMPIHRILSNTITSSLVTTRTGVPIADCQSGFRLMSREVLSAIDIESDGYEAETEFLIKAARKGYRIGFVPIRTIYGTGQSSMTHLKTTRDFLRVLLREY